MKIILQNTLTLTFYGANGVWTKNIVHAKNFESCLEALAESQGNEVRHTTIVVDHEDGHHPVDLRID